MGDASGGAIGRGNDAFTRVQHWEMQQEGRESVSAEGWRGLEGGVREGLAIERAASLCGAEQELLCL